MRTKGKESTITVQNETREALRELAELTGEKMYRAVGRLVEEELRRIQEARALPRDVLQQSKYVPF